MWKQEPASTRILVERGFDAALTEVAWDDGVSIGTSRHQISGSRRVDQRGHVVPRISHVGPKSPA